MITPENTIYWLRGYRLGVTVMRDHLYFLNAISKTKMIKRLGLLDKIEKKAKEVMEECERLIEHNKKVRDSAKD